MAILGFRRTIYKSKSRAAQGLVAYITRERYRDRATGQIAYISGTGEAHQREDCLYTQTRNLPSWAQGSPETYFAAAERYEGVTWVAFEELKVSLPQELTAGQNMALMRDLVDAIAGDKLPITYAFHNPPTLDGQQAQPHLHLILSRRETDGMERTPAQHFKRWQRDHPERGGARKDPAFAERLVQRRLRILIADLVNVHLERAGRRERVHPARLVDRGIERAPEPKLYPSESREYREEGMISPRMQEVLDIREARQHTRDAEAHNAWRYWEGRKADLGLAGEMDPDVQLAVVMAARLVSAAPCMPACLLQANEEAWAVARTEAALVWDEVQGEHESWGLRALGLGQVSALRHEMEDVWQEVLGTEALRSLGQSRLDDVSRETALLWAEDQGTRHLLHTGWEAVEDAREAGDDALEATLRPRQHARQSARTLAALSRALDSLEDERAHQGEEVRIAGLVPRGRGMEW